MVTDRVVEAVLDDRQTAPVGEKMRMTLQLLEKVTLHPIEVTSEDALTVCALFNMIDRLADALDVTVPSAQEFALTGERLLKHSYL